MSETILITKEGSEFVINLNSINAKFKSLSHFAYQQSSATIAYALSLITDEDVENWCLDKNVFLEIDLDQSIPRFSFSLKGPNSTLSSVRGNYLKKICKISDIGDLISKARRNVLNASTIYEIFYNQQREKFSIITNDKVENLIDCASGVLSYFLNHNQDHIADKLDLCQVHDLKNNNQAFKIMDMKLLETLKIMKVTSPVHLQPKQEEKQIEFPYDISIANFPDNGSIPNGTTVSVNMDMKTLRVIKELMGCK